MNFKVGLGYDIHQLVEGRDLFLGGVKIEHNKGLDGHSDAGVILHALCDAILGALGQGDIGEHFPNNDPKYKDISSLKLLDEVVDVMLSRSFEVGNVDIMVQAEEPMINPYKEQMRRVISEHLRIHLSCVNIKATTNEKLGAIGRSEGIAAFANVILSRDVGDRDRN